jgi:hypothetical protein
VKTFDSADTAMIYHVPQRATVAKHQGSITNAQSHTSMNYDGAEGFEFGGGNTKVDPSVAAGQL